MIFHLHVEEDKPDDTLPLTDEAKLETSDVVGEITLLPLGDAMTLLREELGRAEVGVAEGTTSRLVEDTRVGGVKLENMEDCGIRSIESYNK